MVVVVSERTRGVAVLRLFSVSLQRRQNMRCGSTTLVGLGVGVRARRLDRGLATADPQIHTPITAAGGGRRRAHPSKLRAYISIHRRYTTTVATRGVAVRRLYSTSCLIRQHICDGSTTPVGPGRRRGRTSKYAPIYMEARTVDYWTVATRGAAVMRSYSTNCPFRQNMRCGSTTPVDRGRRENPTDQTVVL